MNEWKDRTFAATLWLPGKQGQGVLVEGGFVLTAAHCIDWDTSGGMTLDSHRLVDVRPKGGAEFKMDVLAVEPVADIAVLGPADGQEFPGDEAAFEDFCESTEGVPISEDDLVVREPIPVAILSHREAWIAARAVRNGGATGLPFATVCLNAEASIEGGTSGGPVIDANGLLLGVVSAAFGGSLDSTKNGIIPRPHLALPAWIWRRISSVSKGME